MSEKIKKNIKTVIIIIIIVSALAAAFFLTGKTDNENISRYSSSYTSSTFSKEQKESTELLSSQEGNISLKPSINSSSESLKAETSSKTSLTNKESGNTVSHSTSDVFDGSSNKENSKNILSNISESTGYTPDKSACSDTENSSKNSKIYSSRQEQLSSESSILNDIQSSVSENKTSSEIKNEQSDVKTSITEVSKINNQKSANICTISISCETLQDKKDSLKKNKRQLVTSNGIILSQTSIEFQEGESVFDVTKRLCMEKRIPFEFTITPVYNTAYIEGIYNLYEFDCGSGSGWMYVVNGEIPGCGCSDYKLKNGDVIEWMYTCNLGRDVEKILEDR